MVIGEIQKNFIFPRIPLSFNLPDNYPNIDQISNISIVPQIENFRFTRSELEIKGSYELAVSYFKANKSLQSVSQEGGGIEGDDFFSQLSLQPDGLFTDCCDIGEHHLGELYTLHFTRHFHTYVDLEFIDRPKSFRPGLVVEQIDIVPQEGRFLKGELVFGLINRYSRRSPW